MERSSEFESHYDDEPHQEEFMRIMIFSGGSVERTQELMSKFQINTFIKCMQSNKSSESGKKSRSIMKLSKSFKSKKQLSPYTVQDMFSFQQVPILTSMLRMDQKLEQLSVKIFNEVLRYMGLEEGRPLEKEESIALVVRIHALMHKHPILRDELFMQLEKQTRDNPYKGSCLKAWELMRYCSCAYPPSKLFIVHLSEYFSTLTKEKETTSSSLNEFILATWSMLDRTIKGGCRKTQPTSEEVEGMISGRRMSTNVFTYDNIAEEICYDIATTASEALKDILSRLKLQTYSSFGLFECRAMKKPGLQQNDEPTIEHIRLEGTRYIGDVISDFRTSGWGGYVSCRLLLKRRLFRITEETITDPSFMHLSFIQLRQDYLAGYYWVPADLAAQIAALLILAKLGPSAACVISEQWMEQLKSNWPIRLRPRANIDFRSDVLARCRALGPISQEEAKQQIVRTILALPGGGSIFFIVKTAVDSSELFPERSILAVCSRGLQFLHITSNDVIYSASLRDIEEYAANRERIYFRLMLRGRLHAVEFDTNQGPEICTILDMHIKDALRVQTNEVES